MWKKAAFSRSWLPRTRFYRPSVATREVQYSSSSVTASTSPLAALSALQGSSAVRGTAVMTQHYPRHGQYGAPQRRWFESEGAYHQVADHTLEGLLDAVEQALEALPAEKTDKFDVSYASGVLTIALPPHGTWVLNKQTPNRQIWWSSPLSGPKRFEYDDSDGKPLWFATQNGLSLVPMLSQELSHVLKAEIELNVTV